MIKLWTFPGAPLTLWVPFQSPGGCCPSPIAAERIRSSAKKEVGENQGREVVLMQGAGRFIPLLGVLVYGRMSRVKIWKGNCQKTCVQLVPAVPH